MGAVFRNRAVWPPALTFLICCLLPCSCPAQITFERVYGGVDTDAGMSVQQIQDGGYIIAGGTWSFGVGWPDFYLVQTDSMGDTVWMRTHGGSQYDLSYSVQQTQDAGYIIAGWTSSFGAGGDDVYLIKTNSLGDRVWTKTYGGSGHDRGECVQQSQDGGYIIAGRTYSFGAGGGDVYLIKTDSLGDTVWTKTYGGGDSDYGLSVQETEDGGYIIAGCTRSFGAGEPDAYLIKTDSLGDTVWTRTYGGRAND